MAKTKNKKFFLQALKASAGNVSQACKKSDISRMTYHRWKKTNVKFRKEVEEIQESLIDLAETMLMKNIKEGKTAEIIFYLKTRGRERGYIERMETVNKEVSDFDKLSDDELDKEIKTAEKKLNGKSK